MDAVDGVCPQALCPDSGGFPECVNIESLFKEVKNCKSSYVFSVWKYADARAGTPPEVQPKAKPRAKYVTPYNKLVGALMVTQRRKRQASCAVGNSRLQDYLETSGATCQSRDEVDTSPFSLDPTFQRFSSSYNGKLSVDSAYFDNERANDTDRNPLAFFSHVHDPLKHQSAPLKRLRPDSRKLVVLNQKIADHTKDAKYIHEPSRSLFKLYFDELPTGRQGDRMLAYLQDGKFIDAK